jgi:hypothetical protein
LPQNALKTRRFASEWNFQAPCLVYFLAQILRDLAVLFENIPLEASSTMRTSVLYAVATLFIVRALLAAEPEPEKKRTPPDGPRQIGTRRRAVVKYGGSPKPRSVVDESLRWLAKRQNSNGSWSFDGDFADPGKWKSKTGATGMALLPFLGAGHTHKQGSRHSPQINKGIQFLLRQMKVSREGGDLRGAGDDMVWHAVATAALCEAYALTRDKSLKKPVEKAIRFIRTSQNKRDGGWAIRKGEMSSTTVTFWQVAALRSARMTDVPGAKIGIEEASRFLDVVQVKKSFRYGETSPKDSSLTSTAAGLLCRIHIGSEKDAEMMRQASLYLFQSESSNDAFYTYLANQVLFQSAFRDRHRLWKKWNPSLLERLKNAQLTNSEDAGSWFTPNDPSAAGGGRLFQTSLNAMAFELYYCYSPFYPDEKEECKEQEASDLTPVRDNP